MRNHSRTSTMAVAAVGVLAVVTMAGTSIAGQTPAAQRSTGVQFPAGYKAPRTADGDPDLNDEGRCLLRIGNKEYERWQVRKMALEVLFFVA